ncbi:hypothetical protein IJJ27_00280 [bacterium]|nr:hypothetical protein [bacterium]MBQ6435986.1 hypothetical protein [bacterium]
MSRFIFGLFLLLLVSPALVSAQADLMKSDNYNLELGIMEGEDPMNLRSASPSANLTLPEVELSVTIDAMNVDFGAMTPGIFATRQSNLTVGVTNNTADPVGFSVYTIANKPLQMVNDRSLLSALEPYERQRIDPTNCDAGCATGSAGIWDNADIPGFGYTVVAEDAMSDFAGGTAYRPFPTASHGELPALIARYNPQEVTSFAQRELQIGYKVGVSSDAEAGVYTNVVNYSVVANY